MEAPERIFASRDDEGEWRWPRASKFPEQGPRENVEYLRADIAAARIAELTARAERAEALLADAMEALARIGGVRGPYNMPFPEVQQGYGSFAVVTAREAVERIGQTPDTVGRT